ncbi:MAG: hypothetical protein WCI39_01170 [Gallionellaceae bacterium]
MVSPAAVTPKVSSPSWVMNPEKVGFISVVGAAPQQDWGGREAQFRVALKKAHQELAQMVRVQVQTSSRFKAEASKAGATQDADIESRLQTNVGLQLDAARVIEEWTDPHSGILYIWLVTPN